MSLGPTDGIEEIIIKIMPSRPGISEDTLSRSSPSVTKEPAQSYDALIYTNLSLPWLILPTSPLPGQPQTIAKLPLAAIEHVVVRWSNYREYLAAFVEGEKNPSSMRARLFETLSSGLEVLFSGQSLSDRPIRIWWSSETPELDDLPWELIAYAERRFTGTQFSFVRGLPPETPVPKVPLSGRLRLAFIHDPSSTPVSLRIAMESLSKEIIGLEVVPMTGSPREALLQAVREGYELAHIVADGTVSLAYEGILRLDDPSTLSKLELAPSELSALLRGSRLSILGLTERESSSAETFMIGSYTVPSAYRAFVYLGNSRLPLPNIVAPLGPLDGLQMNYFWYGFYNSLATTLKIEEAMASGRSQGSIAMALFLRRQHRRTFQLLEPTHEVPKVDPNQIYADLQVSRGMVDQLRALGDKYGDLPASVHQFIDSESKRQEQLATELNPWTQVQEGEDE